MHKKNLDIEKLRAVAILLVVLWHSSDVFLNVLGVRTRYFGSWTGVDLFFCISGYVIATSLYSSVSKLRLSNFLGEFYTKRVFRITPSAVLCVAISLAFSYLLQRYAGHEFFADTRRDALPSLLNFADFAYFYKGANHGSTLLGIFWSLSLEEQFYLVVPLLIWGFRRRPKALILLILPIAVWQFFTPRDPWAVLAWPLRTDGLIYGVAIATFQTSFTGAFASFASSLTRLKPAVSFVGVPLLITTLAVVASECARKYTGLSTGWAAVFGGLLVLIGSLDGEFFPGIGPIGTVLVWIGGRSFSIYLFHNLVLVTIKGLNQHYLHIPLRASSPLYYTLVLAGCAALALVCEINYRAVEVPIRNVGRRLAASRFAE